MQAGMDPLIALLTRLSCASCCKTAHMHIKMYSPSTAASQHFAYRACKRKQGGMLERLYRPY